VTVVDVENKLDHEQLLGIVRHLLGTDRALGFLTQLGEKDLRILVASIRERMEADRYDSHSHGLME
jgi:hypothetical protein